MLKYKTRYIIVFDYVLWYFFFRIAVMHIKTEARETTLKNESSSLRAIERASNGSQTVSGSKRNNMQVSRTA